MFAAGGKVPPGVLATLPSVGSHLPDARKRDRCGCGTSSTWQPHRNAAAGQSARPELPRPLLSATSCSESLSSAPFEVLYRKPPDRQQNPKTDQRKNIPAAWNVLTTAGAFKSKPSSEPAKPRRRMHGSAVATEQIATRTTGASIGPGRESLPKENLVDRKWGEEPQERNRELFTPWSAERRSSAPWTNRTSHHSRHIAVEVRYDLLRPCAVGLGSGCPPESTSVRLVGSTAFGLTT